MKNKNEQQNVCLPLEFFDKFYIINSNIISIIFAINVSYTKSYYQLLSLANYKFNLGQQKI